MVWELGFADLHEVDHCSQGLQSQAPQKAACILKERADKDKLLSWIFERKTIILYRVF